MYRRALFVSVAALASLALSPALASASTSFCSGAFHAPGVLAGHYAGNVVVEGFCAVNSGPATVDGNITIRPGSVLATEFALNQRNGEANSRLSVGGDLVVQRNAGALLGCLPPEAACLDDPNQEHPSLSSSTTISGRVQATGALAVIAHNDVFGGQVTIVGGGGGFTCEPRGFFKAFGSPAYTTFEDSSFAGGLNIMNVSSCWMGVIRNTIAGNTRFVANRFPDPDAIEIETNQIGGDLVCRENSMVWDNSEMSNDLFPRQPGPNTVAGHRAGQCVLSSPNSKDDAPGPGPF